MNWNMRNRWGIVLLLAFFGWACSPEKKIQKAFKEGKYERVIAFYKNKLKSDPDNGRANYFVAESYRQSNRLKEAAEYYAKAKTPGVDGDTLAFYRAQALKAIGNYQAALTEFTQLEASTSNVKLKRFALQNIKGINYITGLEEKKNYYKIKNLDALNTPFGEFSPVHLSGELYFSSNRGNGSIYEASGTPYTDIFKAETTGANVDVETVKPLPAVINDDIRNEACVTFSPDGKTMVFAKGNAKNRKSGGIDVDLYVSRFRNGAWGEPTLININTSFKDETSVEARKFSWDSTPCFSTDGRIIYFASNRKGGYGGTDLYSAQVDARGRFGRVKNMGPDINTPGDEMFPYMAENGKFYFSSDGHPGFGMLDLFVVNRVNGKTTVENLGKPMNSTADDFGMFLFKIDRGFFSSNREGGKGDDDIYTFINEDPNLKVVNYFLRGVVYTYKKDSTREAINDATISLLDASDEDMQDYTTDSDGKFQFRVYENEDYHLFGDAEGYIRKRQAFTMKGKSVDPSTLKDLVTNIYVDTVLYLDRESVNTVFQLKNIYFGFDSANINTLAGKELDKLVEILNDNPEILKIELSSHTDNIGTDAKNMDLSQRRANSSVAYLIKRGIAPNRLEAKGYGETKPVALNANADGSDNPAGRARNRRTEFRILELGTPGADKPKGEADDDDRFFKNNND